MAYPSDAEDPQELGVLQRRTQPRLLTLQTVSVYVHEDGTARVFHSRLDTHQYKVISTRLADQVVESSSNVHVALALIAGACEIYEDAGGAERYSG